MGNAGQANYSAAKSAVVGLTKTLAKEWGQFKVNSNAVAFGFIDTRLTQSKDEANKMVIDGEEVQLGIPDQLRGMSQMLIPLGRAAKPEEAAGGDLLPLLAVVQLRARADAARDRRVVRRDDRLNVRPAGPRAAARGPARRSSRRTRRAASSSPGRSARRRRPPASRSERSGASGLASTSRASCGRARAPRGRARAAVCAASSARSCACVWIAAQPVRSSSSSVATACASRDARQRRRVERARRRLSAWRRGRRPDRRG